jgi:hypothetical protein
VSDEEDVARLCFRASFPITRRGEYLSDFDPGSQLYRLEELTWDDFSNRGFSVQRRSLFSRVAAQAALQDRIDRKREKLGATADSLKLEGAVLARVASIRAIQTLGGERAFSVWKEPVDGNSAHACIRSNGGYPRGEFLKYRVQLQAVFAGLRPLSVLPSELDGNIGSRSVQALQRVKRLLVDFVLKVLNKFN